MYPRLVIDLKKIEKNIVTLNEILNKNGVEMVGVTKLFMGNENIANAFVSGGVNVLGDSRIENIVRMKEDSVKARYMMIRIPPLSHLEIMVEHVDIFLVSEPETAMKIDELAQREVSLIYMVDVGDLREGVFYREAVEEILGVKRKLKKAKIIGVGTNVGCFGGVLPTKENLKMIVDIAKAVNAEVISVGGTVYLKALEEGFLPKEVNQFRIGEAVLLGTDVTGNRNIPYLEQGTVILEAEVIEIKRKPSKPIGPTGYDSMGRKPEFEDLGERLRAILAVGEQDINPSGLIPLDEGAKVVHASSDHTIVDVTEVDRKIRVGDVMRFRTNYSATLRAVTSPYVEKLYKR